MQEGPGGYKQHHVRVARITSGGAVGQSNSFGVRTRSPCYGRQTCMRILNVKAPRRVETSHALFALGLRTGDVHLNYVWCAPDSVLQHTQCVSFFNRADARTRVTCLAAVRPGLLVSGHEGEAICVHRYHLSHPLNLVGGGVREPIIKPVQVLRRPDSVDLT